jgi:hypothetical protein
MNTLLVGLILIIPLSLQLRPIAIPAGSFHITLVECIIIYLILAWPLRQLFHQKKLFGDTIFGRYVFLIIFLYSLHLLMGLFFHGAELALGDFRQYLPFFLFFPLISYFDSDQTIGRLRKTVFFILVIVAFYSVILFTFFNEFLSVKAVDQGMQVLGERIYIVNSLSVLFAYLSFMTVKVFKPGSKMKIKLIYLIIIGLNGLMVLIMQSRNLWVMFAIIVLLSVFSLKNNVSKVKFVLIGVYSVILIVSVGYVSVNVFNYKPSMIRRIQGSVLDRLISFTELGKVGTHVAKNTVSIGTLETRLETAQRVIEDHIIPNFLFGSGFGSQIPMVDSKGNIFQWKFQIDNAYLTVLAKFGIIGFLLYLLLTIKIVKSLFRIINTPDVSDEDAILAKSFIYMILGIIIGSFTSSIFIRQQPLIVGFLIMLTETERLAGKYITTPKKNLHGYF